MCLVQVVSESSKLTSLQKLLETLQRREVQQREKSRVLVFVNRIETADELVRQLKADIGQYVAPLHGKLIQSTRDAHLNAFRSGKVRVLVSTDVAARGIHVNNLPIVVNYDFPISIEQYAHRIGRTGRQGKQGMAYTLIAPNTETELIRQLVDVLEETKQMITPKLKELVNKDL